MSDNILQQYNKSRRSKIIFVVAVVVVLFAVIIISLTTGPVKVGISDIWGLITGSSDKFVKQIVYNIRMPRIVAAILTGTALSISGAVIQSLLRNPLASPFTLGISGASAFGAAFAIIIFGAGGSYAGSGDLATINNPYVLAGSAFLWSLLGVAVILMLSRYKGAGPEIIILAGIVISALFGAGISAMQYFADNVQLAAIVFWTFGDFGRANWENVSILGIILVPVIIYFLFQIWNYKALQSGDEYAGSMGVNVSAVRLTGMTVASLATAVAVSFYGIIAFVGLVVPHIVRRIIGGNEQFLIPASALFGALFLLASDTLARTIISPVVLPVGILTSFIGAPLFLFLLIRGMGKNYWS
jgi:iron complex transport system permease protein